MNINLCTSVLPRFSYDQAIDIAIAAGFDGIELRVKDDGHQSLDNLEQSGVMLRRQLEARRLEISVLNSYVGIHDTRNVDRLLACAQGMGVSKVRLVLPRASAAVARLSREKEIIPCYHYPGSAGDLVRSVQRTLRQLEGKARMRGTRILLELHWGTIMSSFSSAALLLEGINPAGIGITFDPANMIVEGREDWAFGLDLTRDYIANVHVKNAKWTGDDAPRWFWTGLSDGMVDWADMIANLNDIQYRADYAIEDFETPRLNLSHAIGHLVDSRRWLIRTADQVHPKRARVIA